MGDSPLSGQQPATPPNGSNPPAQPQAPQPQADPQEFLKQVGGAIQQAVQQATAPILQRLAELESGPPQPQPKANGSGDSFLDRFVSDPETTLGEFLRKGIQETMSPYMQTVLSDGQAGAVAQEQRDFDALYGEGKFKELVKPKLDVVVDNLPEHLRGSREHIKRAVAGIKGSPEMEGQLFELRKEKIKADEEAAAARPPGFVGPGRPLHLEQSTELTEDDETFLAGLQKSGVDSHGFGRETIQQLRAARTPEDRAKVLAPPKPKGDSE